MTELKYQDLDLHNDQDVAEVAKIHCEAPGEWVPDHSYADDSVARAVENLRSSKHCSYVVLARRTDDRIVGMHWVQIEARSEAKFGNIFSLWVHPKYRQQGVATRLKELAEFWLRSNEVSEIRTNVYLENRRMMALNEKLGYKVVLVGMSKQLK
ncbi:GNAT family N-acetyltransferase [Lacimicrobium alkaliphilum]|uniref:N-acetyltransferase domain-containing protein n=1 Tax=Lacimicrobium alkaliphilum TaxID=1526571 RepID=A0ABQ1RD11_9ALTE|nr:hypothetical protein GCM10011357_17610 [Lacimicrobium alkaliphilum]